MALYDNCLSIVNSNKEFEKVLSENDQRSDSLQLSETRPRANQLDTISFYYISDIHLEHQIVNAFPNGATDNQIVCFVEKIISDLLIDDIALLNRGRRILFGGDIASSFDLAAFFYTRFIDLWNKKNRAYYRQNRAFILPLHKEQIEIEKQINVWKKNHKWVKKATKDFLDYSDKRVPQRIKSLIIRNRAINSEIHEKVGYSEQYFLQQWKAPLKRVYAIIGNHELWSFDSIDLCIAAYQDLFSRLGIVYLNNSSRIIRNSNDPNLLTGKVAIIGGIGFAGYNEMYNADIGLYRNTINRNQEICLTKEWEAFYRSSLEAARKENCLLVILTHNPPSDWLSANSLDGNCVYFYGHTHTSTRYYIDGLNTSVFADNQTGYDAGKIEFKLANCFARSNPFAEYRDGIHIVSATDYLEFNYYKGISILGVKRIENAIEKGNPLYLIKDKEYYGFFIVKEKQKKSQSFGTFICVGGSTRKIGDRTDIEHYKNEFGKIIDSYLTILSPYRMAQEKISEMVKAFGGSGKIHGYIIDIDFWTHVMLNPIDGKSTYYFSPLFGYIKTFETLHELLKVCAPDYLDRYLEQNGSSIDKDLEPNYQTSICSDLIQIDIKNSLYPDSKRMNQLQMLFEAKVLRDWNESLLLQDSNIIAHGMTKLLETGKTDS